VRCLKRLHETSLRRGHRVWSLCVKKFLFILFLLATSLRCFSQTGQFKLLTEWDGLVSNSIRTLFQSSSGELWIGTTDGVSVYDGLKFTNYTIRDGLPSGDINCIIEDRFRQGVMWVGTNAGGVSKFSDGVFTTLRFPGGEWENRVNQIVQGDDSTLWCGTDKGLFLIKGDSVLARPYLSLELITVLVRMPGKGFYFSNGGNLWFAASPNDAPRTIAFPHPLHALITSLCPDAHGDLWLGFNDGIVVKMRNDTVRIKRKVTSSVVSLYGSRDGDMWVNNGTKLLRFSAKTFFREGSQSIDPKVGLNEGDLVAVLEDKEGQFWIGGRVKGLIKWFDRFTTKFTERMSLMSPNNTASVIGPNGHLWTIISGGILEVWKDVTLHSVVHPLKISCRALFLREPNLWVMSNDGSVREFAILGKSGSLRLVAKGKVFVPREKSPGPSICFFVDSKDRLWLGTDSSGVVVGELTGKKRVRVFGEKDGLAANSVRAIYEDSTGTIWIGTYINGLTCLRLNQDFTVIYRTYTMANGLPDNSVRSITGISGGRVLVGTRYGGIVVFSRQGLQVYSVSEGLMSDAVWSIYSCDSTIYFGTQLGLQAGTVSDTIRFDDTPRLIGMPIYACGVIRNGLLWGTTFDGVVAIDLERSKKDSFAPPITIREVLIDGQSIDRSALSHLKHDQNTISFRFTGVSLREGKDLSFKFKLFGVDKGWRKASTVGDVTYSSLGSGEYTFVAYAIGSDNLESALPATVAIKIIPPVWSHWWFIFISAALVIGVISVIVRYRIRNLLEIERIRTRIAIDLHDDIGSGLTRIALLSDVIAQKFMQPAKRKEKKSTSGEAAGDALRDVGETARELVEAMSDVVWSINPDHQTLDDVVIRLRSFAMELCEAKNVALNYSANSQTTNIELSMEVLRSMLLVAKEAVHNAVRHSQCKKLDIEISCTNEVLLKIIDDGKGFDANESFAGNGLKNMQSRAQSVGGTCTIRSFKGKGTVVEGRFPI
jgi:ligand-binding sensor domain-containing protein/two-component sensor histidine kinase